MVSKTESLCIVSMMASLIVWGSDSGVQGFRGSLRERVRVTERLTTALDTVRLTENASPLRSDRPVSNKVIPVKTLKVAATRTSNKKLIT